ncbi:unnamed protein product [Amaranthus hypochondriacus]
MAESKTTMESIRHWVVEHKLRTVGCLWLSGIAGSVAYNWSRPQMKTSVRLIHASDQVLNLILAENLLCDANLHCLYRPVKSWITIRNAIGGGASRMGGKMPKSFLHIKVYNSSKE